MSDIEEDEDASLAYGAHPVSLSRKTQEKLEVILTIIMVTIVGNVTFVISCRGYDVCDHHHYSAIITHHLVLVFPMRKATR